MPYGPYSYTKKASEKNPNTNDVSNQHNKMFVVSPLDSKTKEKLGKKPDARLESEMHNKGMSSNKMSYSKKMKY